jgi:alcohol dehydrogenase class IV
MDALTHAVEGFTSTWKNDFTDGICLKAIQLVFQYLPRAVKDGNDMEARERMANAGTLAGMGFINSLAAMAHAAGHSLGGVFHTPHGRAVGLFLPYTIEFIGGIRDDLWAEILRFLDIDIPEGKKASAILAEAIRDLARDINEPLSIDELGIPKDKFNTAMDKLVDNVMADGSLIVSARIPSVAETEKFLSYTFEGKSIDF